MEFGQRLNYQKFDDKEAARMLALRLYNQAEQGVIPPVNNDAPHFTKLRDAVRELCKEYL